MGEGKNTYRDKMYFVFLGKMALKDLGGCGARQGQRLDRGKGRGIQ